MKIQIKLDKYSLAQLTRIAANLERIADALFASRFKSFSVTMEGLMPVYKADKADFDWSVVLGAADSEGNVISDAPIPAGFSLVVASDNDAAISAVQDASDPKLVHSHIGGPNTDGTPSQANLTANLFDGGGNLVATGSAQVTITAGDPATITAITLNLPTE